MRYFVAWAAEVGHVRSAGSAHGDGQLVSEFGTSSAFRAHEHSPAGWRIRAPLERSAFFVAISIPVIALYVPFLGYRLRGLVGVLPLVVVAIMIGLALGRSAEALFELKKGLRANRVLVTSYVWYATGVFLNCIMRGNGLADWRLFLGPFAELITVAYVLTFMSRARAARSVHIAFTIAWGLQAALSLPVMVSGGVGFRALVFAGGGVTEYGHQGIFAAVAAVIPVLAWRATCESGLLRAALVGCVIAATTVLLASTYATPVGLLVIATGATLIVTPIIANVRGSWSARVALAVLLVMGATTAYIVVDSVPELRGVRDRFENAYYDPTSGGYSGSEAITSSRWSLAQYSTNSILDAPLFGVGGGHVRYSPAAGGHSSLLDSLAVYGVLGGGGALVAIVATMLMTTGLRFVKVRSWESFVACLSVSLLTVAGVSNPYWEGGQIAMVLLIARAFRFPERVVAETEQV